MDFGKSLLDKAGPVEQIPVVYVHNFGETLMVALRSEDAVLQLGKPQVTHR